MKTRSVAALTLLALCCLPSLGRQAAGDFRRLSVPGQKWAVEIALPGFVIQRDQMRGDGKARMIQAADTERGYVVSVFYTPVDRAGKSAREYRDEGLGHIKARDGSPFKIDALKPSEYGAAPTLEYFIREHQGLRVNQKHLNAYYVKEGMWVDVHFSKTLFEDGDEKVLHKALDSVRFVEATGGDGAASSSSSPASSAPANAALEHMREASAHFLRGDYRAAIAPYRQALELEKQKPQLGQTMWRVLVDNLGMAYGITGDLPNAKATFEYGLSKDPTYPLFHYFMACTYAEMGDLDGAIRYLKSAFANKRNVIPGEQIPAPETDDSFRRFMKDEKFLRALKELDR
jgi:tetratricopeptide (TPR) repeat protein